MYKVVSVGLKTEHPIPPKIHHYYIPHIPQRIVFTSVYLIINPYNYLYLGETFSH